MNEGWGSFYQNFKGYIKKAKAKKMQGRTLPRPVVETFSLTPSQFRPLGKRKVAVVIHAYYVDMFEEICLYLEKIPVKYTLLISVKSKEDQAVVAERIKRLPLVENAIIRVVNNRGRNIAPMLIDFAPLIKSFDYICHIHTKKSLFWGAEQTEWRNYLYDMQLGSSDRIKAILSVFEIDPSVGIIYPETFSKLPYWCHTWLANKHNASQLLDRLSVRFDPDEYIDYPVGSMFWARRQALEPLLDLQLTYSDFPEESRETDGTLHHTIERCFVIAAQTRGLKYAVILDREKHLFRYRSDRNFEQYSSTPIRSNLPTVLPSATVVSFDIFDTLISRPFANPDMLLKFLEEQVTQKFGINNFYDLRKEAEKLVRAQRNFQGDVKISEIYSVFAELAKTSTDTAIKLLELEVDTETNLLVPREGVIELAKELRNSGKRLILVSDTYLERKYIERILAAKHIDFFDELYLSCEIGKRKDRGDLWEHILECEGISRGDLLHVGDNEQSDVQILSDRGFMCPIHIMKPSVLFRHSNLGEILYGTIKPYNGWRESLLYGLIANLYCLDPNSKELFEHKEPLSNPHAFGYTIFGPIIFSFLSWLIKTSIEDHIDYLKFITREGFTLNQAYEIISKHPSIVASGLLLPHGSYFLCSRRAALFASIRTKEDIPPLLGGHFNGTLWNFFSKRLNVIDMEGIEYRLGVHALRQFVSLPRDYDRILRSITIVFDILIERAQDEREALLQYCAEQGIKQSNTTGLVDLGYSGSIQKALCRLFGYPLAGYYFVTDQLATVLTSSGAICRAYFADFVDRSKCNLPLLHHGLLMEAVLAAPEGQLVCFHRSPAGIVPVFKELGVSQKQFPMIQSIREGVLKFVNEMLDLFGAEALDIGFPKDAMMQIYEKVVTGELQIGSLKKALWVEDDFCGNDKIPVLDWYAQR
ncbi:rhamnan synthesis F family protein [Chloroflexota bacterium]